MRFPAYGVLFCFAMAAPEPALHAGVVMSSVAYSTWDSDDDGIGDSLTLLNNGNLSPLMDVGRGLGGVASIERGHEHRAHADFALQSLAGRQIASAFFVIDPSAWSYFPGQEVDVDLYYRQGNGNVEVDKHNRLDSFIAQQVVSYSSGDPRPIYRQDVTAAVRSALTQNWDFIGFSLDSPGFPPDERQSFEWQIHNNPGTGIGTVNLEYTEGAVAPIPEPSSLILLGIGAVTMIGYSCRRRGRGRTAER